MEEGGRSRKRPLWFVFPGSLGHFEGSGRGLMRIPTFAATIERAAAVLRPFDVNLVWLLTEAPSTAFQVAINCMVSIVAVQVALVDVLRAVGLHPDMIFGTSLGEVGAAYADETLTVEQTMLAAYWRGRCMIEAKVPVGPKALLYTTMEQFAKRCPPDIDVMTFFVDRVLVAGPESAIKNLVEDVSSDGIEVKTFGSSIYQFHTRYIEAAASAVREQLQPIICNPKSHSSKWICTSMPVDEWDSQKGKLISAEFFEKNIRAPVDLITPILLMPENAVLMEISANAQLLSYLKPNLPESVTTIELFCKDASDPFEHLFEAIKKICEATGQQPPVQQLSAVKAIAKTTSQ